MARRFRGESVHKVDNKGRVSIPAPFRRILEEGDPEELGRLMGQLAKRYPHIDVWGGCCGTWDKHFDRIAHYVRAARAA